MRAAIVMVIYAMVAIWSAWAYSYYYNGYSHFALENYANWSDGEYLSMLFTGWVGASLYFIPATIRYILRVLRWCINELTGFYYRSKITQARKLLDIGALTNEEYETKIREYKSNF